MNRVTAAFCCRVALTILVAIGAGACGGGDTDPGPVITVAALSLNPKTTIGGTAVTGTVTLSAAATGSGVSVSLTSSDRAVAVPPDSVVVPAGSTSITFTVTTSPLAATGTANISASVGGTTPRSDSLTVTPPAIVPKVVVSGPSGDNTCRLNSGGQTFDCTFDGSTSTGQIVSYAWDYVLGKNSLTIGASANSRAVNPSTGSCGLFAGETSKGPNTNLEMQVRLTVRDAANTAVQSAPLSVIVVPRANNCGF